jgi:hypothetical protein
MKTAFKYALVFLLGLSMISCTSSILGTDEDDPIIKPPPPPPPPPPGGTGYILVSGTTLGMYA